jgi:DNA-binding transcriptional ArsR family regulator
MKEEDMKLPVVMSEVFKALGDPTRLRIIRMLASEMEKDLSVSELAGKLGITQPSASQHIRVLKSVGILEPVRNGNSVYYNVSASALKRYKENIDMIFEMAFKKCRRYGSCNGHE